MIQSHHSEVPVRRPRAQWELVDILDDVLVARPGNHFFDVGRDCQVDPLAAGCAFQNVKVLYESVVCRHGAVVAGGDDVHLCDFDPTARLQGGMGLKEKAGPVLDGGEHVPNVYQVERTFFPEPVALYIVNLEVQVGWGPWMILVRGYERGWRYTVIDSRTLSVE